MAACKLTSTSMLSVVPIREINIAHGNINNYLIH